MYLLSQSFDFDRTWWRLFKKLSIHTKLDIYVFMKYNLSDIGVDMAVIAL